MLFVFRLDSSFSEELIINLIMLVVEVLVAVAPKQFLLLPLAVTPQQNEHLVVLF
jgi:hypothetical protein